MQAKKLQERIENFMVAVGLINCSDGSLTLDVLKIWLYREILKRLSALAYFRGSKLLIQVTFFPKHQTYEHIT